MRSLAWLLMGPPDGSRAQAFMVGINTATAIIGLLQRNGPWWWWALVLVLGLGYAIKFFRESVA